MATSVSAEASPLLDSAILHAATAADGTSAGNRCLSESELLAFILCVVVGLLEYLLQQPAGGAAVDGGAHARAQGPAALRSYRALLELTGDLDLVIRIFFSQSVSSIPEISLVKQLNYSNPLVLLLFLQFDS